MDVLFRCDAAKQDGLGHLLRCLAIAQAICKSGKKAVFAGSGLSKNAKTIMAKYGFPLIKWRNRNFNIDALRITKFANENKIKIIILDLSTKKNLRQQGKFYKYITTLSRNGFKVVLFEGMYHECISLKKALPIHTVIIPYLNASKLRIFSSKKTKILAGLKYFPFRREIKKMWRRRRHNNNGVLKVLVFWGGEIPKKYINKILLLIKRIANKKTHVKVIGIPKNKSEAIKNVKFINFTHQIAHEIISADLALLGDGLARYESAFLGTPSIIFSRNRFYSKMVQEFASFGCAINGGVILNTNISKIEKVIKKLLTNTQQRQRMANKGQRLIDGKGAERIANTILRNE